MTVTRMAGNEHDNDDVDVDTAAVTLGSSSRSSATDATMTRCGRRRVMYLVDAHDTALSAAKAYTEHHMMRVSRVQCTHALVHSLGLDAALTVATAQPASAADMCVFHREAYVACLRAAPRICGDPLEATALSFQREFDVPAGSTTSDCPLFAHVWPMVAQQAGASLACADALLRGDADVAINWAGGMHHAAAAHASGFCFVNDAVLCIRRLLRRYARVLYLDLDVHHGDGVEAAFSGNARVLTVSLHQYGDGFFPGTGGYESNSGSNNNGHHESDDDDDDVVMMANDTETYRGHGRCAVTRSHDTACSCTSLSSSCCCHCCCSLGSGVTHVDEADADAFATHMPLSSSSSYTCDAAMAAAAAAGSRFAVNVPLPPRTGDAAYLLSFRMVLTTAVHCYDPQAVVVQCGADTIAGDLIGRLCVTTVAHTQCVADVLALGLPTVLLGGGGYHVYHTAQCWAVHTATALGRTAAQLPCYIPRHDPYYAEYRKACVPLRPTLHVLLDADVDKPLSLAESMPHVWRLCASVRTQMRAARLLRQHFLRTIALATQQHHLRHAPLTSKKERPRGGGSGSSGKAVVTTTSSSADTAATTTRATVSGPSPRTSAARKRRDEQRAHRVRARRHKSKGNASMSSDG